MGFAKLFPIDFDFAPVASKVSQPKKPFIGQTFKFSDYLTKNFTTEILKWDG